MLISSFNSPIICIFFIRRIKVKVKVLKMPPVSLCGVEKLQSFTHKIHVIRLKKAFGWALVITGNISENLYSSHIFS